MRARSPRPGQPQQRQPMKNASPARGQGQQAPARQPSPGQPRMRPPGQPQPSQQRSPNVGPSQMPPSFQPQGMSALEALALPPSGYQPDVSNPMAYQGRNSAARPPMMSAMNGQQRGRRISDVSNVSAQSPTQYPMMSAQGGRTQGSVQMLSMPPGAQLRSSSPGTGGKGQNSIQMMSMAPGSQLRSGSPGTRAPESMIMMSVPPGGPPFQSNPQATGNGMIPSMQMMSVPRMGPQGSMQMMSVPPSGNFASGLQGGGQMSSAARVRSASPPQGVGAMPNSFQVMSIPSAGMYRSGSPPSGNAMQDFVQMMSIPPPPRPKLRTGSPPSGSAMPSSVQMMSIPPPRPKLRTGSPPSGNTMPEAQVLSIPQMSGEFRSGSPPSGPGMYDSFQMFSVPPGSVMSGRQSPPRGRSPRPFPPTQSGPGMYDSIQMFSVPPGSVGSNRQSPPHLPPSRPLPLPESGGMWDSAQFRGMTMGPMYSMGSQGSNGMPSMQSVPVLQSVPPMQSLPLMQSMPSLQSIPMVQSIQTEQSSYNDTSGSSIVTSMLSAPSMPSMPLGPNAYSDIHGVPSMSAPSPSRRRPSLSSDPRAPGLPPSQSPRTVASQGRPSLPPKGPPSDPSPPAITVEPPTAMRTSIPLPNFIPGAPGSTLPEEDDAVDPFWGHPTAPQLTDYQSPSAPPGSMPSNSQPSLWASLPLESVPLSSQGTQGMHNQPEGPFGTLDNWAGGPPDSYAPVNPASRRLPSPSTSKRSPSPYSNSSVPPFGSIASLHSALPTQGLPAQASPQSLAYPSRGTTPGPSSTMALTPQQSSEAALRSQSPTRPPLYEGIVPAPAELALGSLVLPEAHNTPRKVCISRERIIVVEQQGEAPAIVDRPSVCVFCGSLKRSTAAPFCDACAAYRSSHVTRSHVFAAGTGAKASIEFHQEQPPLEKPLAAIPISPPKVPKSKRKENKAAPLVIASRSLLPIAEDGVLSDTSADISDTEVAAARNRVKKSNPWALLELLFTRLEQRWAAWKLDHITFADVISKEKEHALIKAKAEGAQLCDGCHTRLGTWCCPPVALPIECEKQHWACDSCYSEGFKFHHGFLGGSKRYHRMMLLQKYFQKADKDSSGYLDFLEWMYLSMHIARSLFGSYDRARAPYLQLIRDTFVQYSTEDQMSFSELQALFENELQPVPAHVDLQELWQKYSQDGILEYHSFLWVLYNATRPDSSFLIRVDSKPMDNLPRVDSLPKRAEKEARDIPVFEPSKCRKLKVLGQGGMSIAWLLDYDGEQVVGKYPKPGTSTKSTMEMLQAARTQQKLRHRNVLAVLGIAEKLKPPAILLEVAAGGDLSDWYGKKVDPVLQWKVAKEVAEALAYLHTCNPPMMHRDLKGANVFLTKGQTAKLADFDMLAEIKPPTYTVTGICGTPGFMAPELIAGRPYDTRIDIFSYASLLYEITHGAFPFSKEVDERSCVGEQGWFDATARLTKAGNRPVLDPAQITQGMSQLIQDCWNGNPDARPSMSVVVQRLNTLSPNVDADKI